MTRLAAWKITTTVTGTGVINCKMKKAMKKITYLLIAAITLVSVASCVKDQFENFGPENPYGSQEFTVSLASQTRTTLSEGKTVWGEGDTLWVSNGSAVDTIAVPESAYGLKEFSFKTVNATPTEANPKVFAVYPFYAASKVSDDKVVVSVPGVQDGAFASANICAGVSNEGVVALRNVTGILKFTVPEGTAADIYQVVLSGVGETVLAGECTVDLSSDTPVVTAAKTSSSLTLQTFGVPDDYYAAVIPGTFEAGFKMTAATVVFEHASETKISTVANTVGINQIIDLGVIGTDLKPLDGEGTEASPYLIENLGHMIALASAVDNGEESQTFAGKYFKVMNDIAGVNLPIGVFSSADRNHPFCGDFDGNNHTITVDLNSAAMTYPHRMGLFGALNSGANIHDLTVDGKVVSTGEAIGAVVGRIDIPEAAEAPVTLANITNKATVSAKGYVGGILGYAKDSLLAESGSLFLKNCKNQGTVTASASMVGGVAGYLYGPEKNVNYYSIKVENAVNEAAVTGVNSVGGVAGYVYRAEFDSPINAAAVTSTATKATAMFLSQSGLYATTALSTDNANPWRNATGGIVGVAQNVKIDAPINSGSIKAFIKVGGIAGLLYWGYVNDASNTGSVTASGSLSCRADSQSGQQWGSVAGGIAGWLHTGGAITKSKNTGEINGIGGCGGVVGFVSCSGSASSFPLIDDCENTAKVYSEGAYQGGTSAVANPGTGGICGMTCPYIIQNSDGKTYTYLHVTVKNCVNRGDVTSYRADGQANFVGGIVGNDYEANKQYKEGSSNIVKSNNGNVFDNNTNYGTITGGYWVGGIMGGAGNRYSGYHIIRNCANHGKVVATGVSSKYSGICAGGIAGGSHTASGSSSSWRERAKFVIKNCYNDGDVVYTTADCKTPYVGGLVGSTYGGSDIQNSYSIGNVGVEGGAAPAEDALNCLGSLVGYQYATAGMKYSYYPAALLAGKAIGGGAAADASVVAFGADYFFPTVVSYKEADYDDLVSVLCAWATAETGDVLYRSWVPGERGPVFAD